jgi:hypothetical protein
VHCVAAKHFMVIFVLACVVHAMCPWQMQQDQILRAPRQVCVADVVQCLATLASAKFHELCQHPGFNSLYDIDCGGNPYGVFSMIHTEGLHALDVGIIDYCLQILYDMLTPTQKSWLDCLVKHLVAYSPGKMATIHFHSYYGQMV